MKLIQRLLDKNKIPKTAEANIVRVAIVHNRGWWRVNMSYDGGHRITSSYQIQLRDDEPSGLYGFENWTAGEAYRHRKEHHEDPHSIPIRERRRIRDEADARAYVQQRLEGTEYTAEVRVFRYEDTLKRSYQRWFTPVRAALYA